MKFKLTAGQEFWFGAACCIAGIGLLYYLGHR